MKRNVNGFKDEFYTLKEDVERIEENYREFLKGRTLYCFADTEESEFVKVLKERGYDVKYSSDDITKEDSTFERNLREHKDYVFITNPPFSLISYIISRLVDSNVDFIIMGPPGTSKGKEEEKMVKGVFLRNPMGSLKFQNPDGKKRAIGIVIFTSFLAETFYKKEFVIYDGIKYPYFSVMTFLRLNNKPKVFCSSVCSIDQGNLFLLRNLGYECTILKKAVYKEDGKKRFVTYLWRKV